MYAAMRLRNYLGRWLSAVGLGYPRAVGEAQSPLLERYGWMERWEVFRPLNWACDSDGFDRSTASEERLGRCPEPKLVFWLRGISGIERPSSEFENVPAIEGMVTM